MVIIESMLFCSGFDKAGYHIRIYNNKTDLDFITSDNPAVYFDRELEFKDFQTFGVMPLTPNLLVHFSTREGYRKITFDTEPIYRVVEIVGFNDLIAKNAYNLTTSKNKESL